MLSVEDWAEIRRLSRSEVGELKGGDDELVADRSFENRVEHRVVLPDGRAESPSAAAMVTQSFRRDGVLWSIICLPKDGKKCLARFDTYAALMVALMCLDGSQSFSA